MSPAPIPTSQRVLKALACSTVEPGLTGVLLFNLDAELITPVADAFERILHLAGGRSIRRVTLGAATVDDELWLVPRLLLHEDRVSFATVPGPLVESDPDTSAVLVVVPDLVRLSLAGARAAVQLLGADVAAVERYGFRARWRPRSRWLAVCAGDEAGRISPHLLERFPIRVDAAGLGSSLARADRVLAGVAGQEVGDDVLEPLPEPWRAVLGRRGQPPSVLSADAAQRVTELLDPTASTRRTIALARLTRALATLDGASTGGVGHVEAAVRLIGLRTAAPAVAAPALPEDAALAEPTALPQPRPAEGAPGDLDQRSSGGEPSVQPVLETGPAESLEAFPVDEPDPPGSPYPEDDAAPLREFAPLRTPWQQGSGPASTRGPVIGVRQVTNLCDLAFVPTAMEAAKYQKLPSRRERAGHDGAGRLVIFPGDLRSYVRSPQPERMLTILLDHTCRKGWDWQDALAPYLRWAYAGRATACIVEVGSRLAAVELCAEKFITRSVLDPRIGVALYRPAGQTTPLAHGLHLAAQVLRHAFQHQRSSLVEAWLVVVSDGRGNVPLEASMTGRLAGLVGRDGVDDAMAMAADIGTIDKSRLHAVVVDPVARPYAGLPFDVAHALGGDVVPGRVPPEAGDAG